MDRAKSVLFATAALLASSAASAVQVSGPLTELWIRDSAGNQFAWLRTSTPFTSTCGQSSGYMYIDLTEPGGKETYAMALAAFISGTNVTIGGTQTCSGTFEKVKFLYMAQ